MAAESLRLDYKIIYEIVEPGARVLDLGCGSGDLLYHLVRDKNAKVQGIEFDDEAIYQCVKKGLSVFNSDIESGLVEYPDKSFDYVILNQSMQEVTQVDYIIHEALRVGGKVIVGFPNFAHIAARFRLFLRGRAPMTKALPHHWYNTPNVRSLSLSDFREFCQQKDVQILKAYYLGEQKIINFWPNLFALNAIFVLARQ
ncbi:MAG: methionine biosynthesis protein MetW [Deltaproteobacteria bacterium]|jgi:methionine biosynthesis protein MetW|nr:methionine biosynthesis protein MetW [Deltaproteobacteria bacterium]